MEEFREGSEHPLKFGIWTGPIAHARVDKFMRHPGMARDDLLSQLSRLPRRTPPRLPAFAFRTPAVSQ